MARMTAADMARGARKGAPKPVAKPRSNGGASPAPSKAQTVKIPPGGRAHVEKASNGVSVTVTDKRYREVTKVVSSSPDKLTFE